MVAHLLKVNVDIESRDRAGDCTPLMWAVKGGNETTVDFLLASGALVDSIEYRGRTPLWFAAQLGKAKIAEKLINCKALMNPELILEIPENVPGFDHLGLNGSSPLGAAFSELIVCLGLASHKEASYLNVIRLLLGRGALVDSGRRTESPLWLAIGSWPESGHGLEVIVKMLLSKGADINFQHTKRLSTPLHQAVNKGTIPILKLILEGKPKLEVQNSKGETPLHNLLSGFHRDTNGTILQMLLERELIKMPPRGMARRLSYMPLYTGRSQWCQCSSRPAATPTLPPIVEHPCMQPRKMASSNLLS